MPLTVAVAAGALLLDGRWGKLSALAAGICIGFWFYAIDAVPEHIARWERGADGEQRTADALRPLLRAGWQVIHDLDRPGGGNIDHLLIGPGGIFVVDSKVWNGVVSITDRGPTITPRDQPEATWLARDRNDLPGTANTLARTLGAATHRAIPAPQPVIVIWAPFPARVATAGRITYVAGPELADWLTTQAAGKPALRPEHVQALAAAATAMAPAAGNGGATPGPGNRPPGPALRAGRGSEA